MDSNDFGDTGFYVPDFNEGEAVNVDGDEGEDLPPYRDFDFEEELVAEEAGPRNPTEKAVGVFIRIAYAFEGECRSHFEAMRVKFPAIAELSDFENKVTSFAAYVTGLTDQGLPAAEVQEALDNNDAEVQLDGLIQTASELFENYGLQMKAATFEEWRRLTVVKMEVDQAVQTRQQTARDAIEQLRESFLMLAMCTPALRGHVMVTEELLTSLSDIERSLDILTDAKGDMSLQSIIRVHGIFLNCLSASFDDDEDEFFAVVFSRMERKDYECARAAIENPWVCKEEEDFKKVVMIFMECLEELLEGQKAEILNRIVDKYESIAPQA